MSGRHSPPPQSPRPAPHDGIPPLVLPTRRDGKPKSRLSWDEKLQLLDPRSPVEMTKSRLKDFANLFAGRTDQAIATLVGHGPRAWATLLHCPLTHKHIARHLLADRIPSLRPQWFGPRSHYLSLFLCIDVDPDRDGKRTKGSFVGRCLAVAKALRRMGIDVRHPRQVLVQPSPSGGRHYYVFFDGPNPIDEYHRLLRAAGLKHTSGQVEFYPSETHGLRLPFGHIPGTDHDPRAWLQFIDDYKNGRIRRHSLKVLADRLKKGRKQAPAGRPIWEKPPAAKGEAGDRKVLGIPKRHRTGSLGSQPRDNDAQDRRYLDLMENGLRSFQDAKDLETLGIRMPGTRNRALNMLAAHHIFIRHKAAEEVKDYLLRWSMDVRHESKDIRSDLEKGTNFVEKQLGYMCPWYKTHKEVTPSSPPVIVREKLYAAAELEALRPSIMTLPEPDRLPQAHFLLEFLIYARRNGWSAPDGSGREAAVAINEVMRKWPGCRGSNKYKTRIDRAIQAGIFRVVREKWHNHEGPGRPRTYCLSVPAIDPAEADVGYDLALSYLTGQADLGPKSPPSPQPREEATRSQMHEPVPNPSGGGNPRGEGHPGPLRPGCPQRTLGQAPHQRNPERPSPQDLPDSSAGFGAAPPTSRTRAMNGREADPGRSPNGSTLLDGRIAGSRPVLIQRTWGPKSQRCRPIIDSGWPSRSPCVNARPE